jgi:hypothetical protein
VALFDAAAVSARAAAGPSDRSDDATSVVPLPFSPDELTFSRDGSLLAAFGAGGLAFIAPATGMVLWPETTAPLQGAAELRPLAFPGAGGDLIVAAFPAGVVSALPPPVIAGATPSGTASANAAPGGDAEAAKGVADDVPATVGPSAAMALDPRTPEATSKEEAAAAPTSSEGPPAAPAPDAAPVLVTAPAPAPGTAATPPAPAAAPVSPPAPATAPAPSTARPDEDSRATLSGAIHGDRARARAIVLYGPSSIVREFARATPDAGGEWRLALPPPGVYRIVVIGDGSTPIPVAPAFITVTLTEGTSQAGLDFTVGRSP